MGYRRFSTENADYVLQLVNHYEENLQNPFRGVDALVIETGSRPLSLAFLDDILTRRHKQLALPVRHAKEHNLPVFSADVPLTWCGEFRDTLMGIIECRFNRFIAADCCKPAELSDAVSEDIARFTYRLQNPVVEGRNAINACKIERWIVPSVAESSGWDRPKIGLCFGYWHVGMEQNLVSEKQRNRTLWNWQHLNFGRWAGFDAHEIDKVRKAVHDGDRWHVEKYGTGLFG